MIKLQMLTCLAETQETCTVYFYPLSSHAVPTTHIPTNTTHRPRPVKNVNCSHTGRSVLTKFTSVFRFFRICGYVSGYHVLSEPQKVSEKCKNTATAGGKTAQHYCGSKQTDAPIYISSPSTPYPQPASTPLCMGKI